jgi:hypothetical protein
MPHCKKTVQTDRQQQEKPTAQNGTFGFALHTSQRFAKPKSLSRFLREAIFLPTHRTE